MQLGEVLYYGGMIGIAVFGFMMIIMFYVYEFKKRRMRKNIEREF